MNFYGQRGEDKKMWDLLDMDNRKTPGFYIDVGAWHPVFDNVTKVFYDLGWSGVNIEPNPAYHEILVEQRPRDKNLQIAVSDRRGIMPIHILEDSGLTTFVDEYAMTASNLGFKHRRFDVKVLTLREVIDRYVSCNQLRKGIDFLKIDVEGWEEQVILGMDFRRYRPRIVMVEATVPTTDIPNWEKWDPILINEGYSFLEFDGLNRWYEDNE